MRTRTRKILSLLLATAMVFTMNTSVFAAEITEDEAAIESVAVDEAEAAVEEAAAEISTVSDARGWSYTVSGAVLSGNLLQLKGAKDGTPGCPVTLIGTTDSDDLTVSPCDAQGEIASFKVNPGDDVNAGSSVQVTFVASDDDGFGYLHYTSGNQIVSVYEDFTGDDWGTGLNGREENFYSEAGKKKAEKNFKAFAAAACGTGVESTTSVDFKSGMASATFILPTSVVEEKNVSYGYDSKTFDSITGSLFEFNTKAPYSGNLKNADLVKLLGIGLSANNESYTVKKMKLKHKKSWGNKGRIYVQKITGGTKKYRNKLKKAINKAKIDVEIYPYNLNASDSKAKVKKIKKKSGNAKYVKIKLYKKNTTLKSGKSDKWGGTPSFSVSGDVVTVSGSNLFVGDAKK